MYLSNSLSTLELLKKNKIKATPQRIAIYNMLVNTKQHPSVDIIYKSLKKDFPSMSLATIYKTVDMFKEAGLIQELKDASSTNRYDANIQPHPHLICIKCNRIDDLEMDLPFSEDIISTINDTTNYTILYSQICLYGYCPDCKMKARK